MSNRIRGDFYRTPIEISASGVLVPAATGKIIRVNALWLMANGTVNVQFRSGAGSPSVDLTGLAYLVANSGLVLPLNDSGWFDTVAGAPLALYLSGSVAVGGLLNYTLVP